MLAAHVLNVVHLHSLALGQAKPGMVYHAAVDKGVTFHEIAPVIGGFRLPVAPITAQDAATHFDWPAPFVARDAPASRQKTQQQLVWQRTGSGMTADLEAMRTGLGKL